MAVNRYTPSFRWLLLFVPYFLLFNKTVFLRLVYEAHIYHQTLDAQGFIDLYAFAIVSYVCITNIFSHRHRQFLGHCTTSVN